MGREEAMSQQRLEVIDPATAPPVWAALRNEAHAAAKTEAALASLLAAVILNHESLGERARATSWPASSATRSCGP